MKSRPLSLLQHALPLALLALATAPAAALQNGLVTLEVLVDGRPLAEHAARGTTYIEATADREYSIRLQNQTGSRIAVALSVDGLNTIDARTTSARDAAKWILDPWQSVTLDGWQTGSSTARRFFFTTERRSYGAWLGETENLGLVTAVAFREKARPVALERERRGESRLQGKAARPEAPAADAAESSPGLSDDYAATGIGREVEHRVERVSFEAEPSPAAVLELRYEFRDALVDLGVLPPPCAMREEPLARRERARGFEDLDFAPDPYRGGRR